MSKRTRQFLETERLYLYPISDDEMRSMNIEIDQILVD